MTTTPTKQPKQYRLDDLLSNSVQPFANLDEETLAAMGQSMGGAGELLVPIVMTADGVLVDGHQRIKAMLDQGRTMINANDVRVIPNTTKDDALEWAVKLNVQRRHLSVQERAALATDLRHKRGWSDGKIAEAFGVSSMTIGRWLKYEPKLDQVVSKDGSIQPTTNKPQQGTEAGKPMTKPGSHPWQGDGTVLRGVVRLTAVLEEMLQEGTDSRMPLPSQEELGEQQYGFCEMRLKELTKAISGVLAAMKQPQPAKPKAPVTKRPAKTMADQSK